MHVFVTLIFSAAEDACAAASAAFESAAAFSRPIAAASLGRANKVRQMDAVANDT